MFRRYDVLHNLLSCFTMSSPELFMWKWKAKWLMSAEMKGEFFAVECEETSRCIFLQKKNEYNISWDYLMEWNCLQYSAAGWMFCSSFNANFEDTQASTFVALLCCLRSHTCPVAEGSPSVLWGVCTAAGEGAGAGPAEGGRVSVCPQGHARQDPGHGEGGFPWAWCTADFNQHPVLLYDL